MGKQSMQNANRPIQYFTDEYLEHCKSLSIEERLTFLTHFAQMVLGKNGMQNTKVRENKKAISLRIAPEILTVFKQKCAEKNVPYGRQIEVLMSKWLAE